jgi:hypothetical protein
MREDARNPNTNQLGNGVTEEKLNSAVSKSGYPLQTKVAHMLKDDFHIIEEWSFIDNKTHAIRAIDLLAQKEFYSHSEHPRIRPTLDLIIECKQSELPFVFFLSGETRYVPRFPYIAGLAKDEISIRTDTDKSTWHLSVVRTLNLEQDTFLSNPPAVCNKFSKCERKGADLHLSGEETYNGIVYPILKAMAHFKYMETPPKTAFYFDCHLVLGIAVLDAPMVGVEITKHGHELVYSPWVRAIKHLPAETPDITHMNNIFAIDIVHKDFFSMYIMEHVLPFSHRASQLFLKHQEVLAETKGFVSNMNEVIRSEIESHLTPNKNLKDE